MKKKERAFVISGGSHSPCFFAKDKDEAINKFIKHLSKDSRRDVKKGDTFIVEELVGEIEYTGGGKFIFK